MEHVERVETEFRLISKINGKLRSIAFPADPAGAGWKRSNAGGWDVFMRQPGFGSEWMSSG